MMWQKKWVIIVIVIAIGMITTLYPFSHRMFRKKRPADIAFSLSSPAFIHNGNIPPFYTCDGRNVSPALVWKNPPTGTQSYVLICHDPDALGGEWVHWIVYDIPAVTTDLAEHVKVNGINAKQGVNSWNEERYDGPCPPLRSHHYIFTLYALDIPMLNVKHPVTRRVVEDAMSDHIIGKALLMGRYQRTTSI